MNNMNGLYKYLQAFLMLILASACSKTPVDLQSEYEIVFDDIKTRGFITQGSEIEAFGVYAQTNFGSGYSSWLENESVVKDGGQYSFESPKYWMNDCKYFFSAIYPLVLGTQMSVQGSSYLYKIPFTTTSQSLSNPVDLMVAHTEEITSPSSSSGTPDPVSLNFEHKLSKITFKIAKSNDNSTDVMTLQGISLSGIITEGICHTSRLDGFDKWELGTESSTLQISGINTTLGPSSSPYTKDFLFIPQKIYSGTGTSNVIINVMYTFQDRGVGELETTFVEKAIPVDVVDEWLAGKHITYTLTITYENDIIFSTPSVSSWGIQQSGGTIIIK